MSLTNNVSEKEATDRQQYLDSLDDFIYTSQERITSMLDSLGWTPEHFMQPRNLSQCPHDKNHLIPKSTLDSHVARCQYASQGYGRHEAERILEDTSYAYKDAPCVYSVKLDLQTMNSVLWNHHAQNHSVFYGYKKLPLLPEEEEQEMNREDRLGLSEYIIKRAKQANRLKELGKDELLASENLADLMAKGTTERRLEPVEEMAALRDFKRRRQSYRAKNVHITKKSHTEIMREVINNQMDMYSKLIRDESGQDDLEDKGEGHSVTMDTSEKIHYDRKYDNNSHRHRSRSSSKNRSYKKSRHRSRSRSEDRESYRSREYSSSKYSRSKYRSRSRSEDRRDNYDSKNRSRSRDREDKSDTKYRSESTDRGDNYGSKYRSRSRDREDKSDTKYRSESTDRGDNYETKNKEKYETESRSPSSEKSKKSKHKKHKHKSKKSKKSGKRKHHSDYDDDDIE